MSKEDLIPFNKMPKEKHLEIAARGGSRSTPAKKLAARIRCLKQKGLTNDDAKLLSDMMHSGEVLDLDILMGLQKLVKSSDNKTKTGAYGLLLRLSEKLHGTRNTDSVNIQINMLTIDDREKEIKRILGDSK